MQRGHMMRVVVSCCAAGAVGSSALGAAMITAGFDMDAEGFVGSTTSSFAFFDMNTGNPPGSMCVRKELMEPEFDVGIRNSVTPEFLGDYGAGGITGAGFDVNVGNFELSALLLRFRVDVNTNGWHYDFGAVQPDNNNWESFDVMFDPTWDDVTAMGMGWTQESGAGSFAATMASVGWIEARAINEGSLIMCFDNVRLVPAPSALALVGLIGAAGVRRRRA